MSFESPQIATGFAAGGDLAGTYPSPTLAPAADYEKSSAYHRLIFVTGRLDAVVAQTTLLRQDSAAAATAAPAGLAVFYLDPADYPVGTKTSYLRTQITALVNATTPVADFTLGLYPVTACAGAAATVSVTLGAVVAGSTVAIAAPTSSTLNFASGTVFAFPAAGFYAIGVVVSASMAANSSVAIRGVLARNAS